MNFLAAAGEHDVLLVPLDLFGGRPDAVQRGRAGRRDRVVHAENLEGRGQRRRRGGAHRLGHGKRANASRALLAGNVGGRDNGSGRWPARAHDDAGARVGNVGLANAGIGDGLFHRHVVPARAFAHEAIDALVDMGGGVDVRLAADLTFEIVVGKALHEADTALAAFQRGGDFLRIIPDRGNDPQPRNDDTTHDCTPAFSKRTGGPVTWIPV